MNNANGGIEDPDADQLNGPEGGDSLLYSAGTGTLGASSLNFGFSGNKSYLRNDLSLKAAQLSQKQ